MDEQREILEQLKELNIRETELRRELEEFSKRRWDLLKKMDAELLKQELRAQIDK